MISANPTAGARTAQTSNLHSVNSIRWEPRITTPQQERAALALAQQYGLPELLARVLAGRGVTPEEAEDFLNPTLKTALPDPSHLLDMDKAAARLAQAVQAGETVAVFGDYDVDGATSTALLRRYFARLGIELLVYIPDRMKEGYGPNLAAFEQLKARGASLILTVDCGTVAFEPIAAIRKQGVDVIVIDHHIAQPQLPEALAVVNPNRVDQDSDCGHLAAVGVTFLLLVALNRVLRNFSPTVCRSLRERSNGSAAFAGSWQPDAATTLPDLLSYLDLVALGTVCDVVPLTGLNRAFVAQGLHVMAQRCNPGLAALSDIARLDEPPGAYHAGFLLGPRINAGGRVGEAALGSRLLSSDDPDECRRLAQRLDGYNAERQAIEADVLEAAMAQAVSQADHPCIIVAQEGWHEGVIGIVAGRLKEAYDRPALVVTFDGEAGKGSARSVAGADIGAAITSAKLEGLLRAGGGHSMAAGFSLQRESLEALTAFLHSRLASAVAGYQAGRSYRYDGLISVGGLNLKLLSALERAGPFGMGNPSARFVIPDVRLLQCERMKDKHLRLLLADAAGGPARLKAVAFNITGSPVGDALEGHGGRTLHLAGQLKRNRWQGYESAQFVIDDVAL